MRSRLILVAGFAPALVLGAPAASAAAAFDNGFDASLVSNGGLSDFAAPNPPNTFLFEHADDFVLPAGANAYGALHWLGFYSDSGTDADVPSEDDFTLRLFAADGPNADAQFGDGLPLPGTLLGTIAMGNGVNRVATSSVIPGLNLRVYSYSFGGGNGLVSTFPADTRFWLSIVNNTDDDDNDSWYWATTGDGNGTSRFTDPENPPITDWSAFGSKRLAFQFDSAPVPLPASAFLLGSALLALGASRRR